MKKFSISLFLIMILVLCSSCGKEEIIKEESENVLHCTRNVTAQDNMTTDIKYSIYYDGDYVTKTVAIEKVTSNDNNILKKYKEAYEKVFSNYKDIDYYDNKVEQNGNTVSSTTVVDYKKVDVNKIIEIEGKADNIFEEDGKVKKDTLVSFYKKYGITCK